MQRVTLLTCLAVTLTPPANLTAQAEIAGVALENHASGFVSPVMLIQWPGTKRGNLVVDQVGLAYLINAKGQRQEAPYLDVRSKTVKLNEGFDERGLLSMAFHPNFAQNRKVYAVYSAPLRSSAASDWDHTMRLVEFTAATTNALSLDLSTEKILLEIDKPWGNHNSGCIAFGGDGFLYYSVGDGGNMNGQGRGHSPQGNSQDPSHLLGKMLRIDVNTPTGYGIPKDNPFAKGGGRPEIFAMGLRNTWRFSVDRGGSRQVIGADVGQDSYEEVNVIENGANYGWNIREGFVGFNPNDPLKHPADAPTKASDGKPFHDPLLVYKNFKAFPKDADSGGISITGGYVYRGAALPQLQGKYVFGDWSRQWVKPDGAVYIASPGAAGQPWNRELLKPSTHPTGSLGGFITAFGEDGDGEVYVLTNGSTGLVGKTGIVWKLVPSKL